VRIESRSERLLTPGEIAAALGVTPTSVRRWINAGALEAIRLGTGPHARLRVREAELARFVRPTRIVP
jgi:excisionase family DNA binding protein